ncbi:MAG: hypothetical protein ACRELC_09360 [Gemmatimonadota bacterium]
MVHHVSETLGARRGPRDGRVSRRVRLAAWGLVAGLQAPGVGDPDRCLAQAPEATIVATDRFELRSDPRVGLPTS